ncbi:hypothetical protein KAU08_12560, partial [bacterium]|nr:hypothetical protein [bacterium]
MATILIPIRLALVTIFVGVFLLGCSSGGKSTPPVLPDNPSSTTEITGNIVSPGENNHRLLLYNLIQIDATDPEDIKTEIIPIRSGAMHLNILKLLEVGPCTNCFEIVNLNIPQPGVLDVQIQFTHPFTDKELTAFDVRGTIMFNGSHVFPDSGLTISDSSMGDGELLNAEGYTALYNGSTFGMAGPFFSYFPGKLSTPLIPNADVNGYIRYRTETTRNMFRAGQTRKKTYTLKMPASGQLVLGYAVDANWAVPPDVPYFDPVTDFGPEANCPEAWKIEVEDIGPGITWEGGTTELQIDIYDWQGKDDAHPVIVECPDLFDGEILAEWVLDENKYTRYKAEISNIKLAGEGYHRCLIRKEAAENDPQSQPWLDLTAYQLFNVLVMVDIPTPVDVTPPWLNFSPHDVCTDGNYA